MLRNFSLIAYSKLKLCFIEVAKSDACTRPLFANPVTYIKGILIYVLIQQILNCLCAILYIASFGHPLNYKQSYNYSHANLIKVSFSSDVPIH